MSDLELRTDITATGLARLIQQFRGKPRIQALLGIYLDEFQELENARYDVYTKTWIDDGEGAQLDGLGDIVGEARQGSGDVEYRCFLRARVRANESNGYSDELIYILLLILGDTAVIGAREFYPATLVLQPFDGIAVTIRRVFLMLDDASTSGTSLRLIYSQADNIDCIIGGYSQDPTALPASQCGGYSGVSGIGGGVGAGVFA